MGLQIQPVKAHLLPVESRLPEALLLPNLPPPVSMGAFDGQPVTPAQTTPSVAPPIQAKPAATTPNRSEPPSVQRAPQAPVRTEVPPATQVAGPADEDRNWRRLQTIYKRHQEKQQAENAGEEIPEPAQPASGEQFIPVEKLADHGSDVPAPTGSGEPIHPQPQESKPAKPPTPGDDEHALQAGSQTTPPAIAIQRKTVTLPAPAVGPQPPSKDLSAQDAQQQTIRPPSAGQAEPEDESADSRPTQSLPLEAVWPVQRSPQEPAAIQEAPMQNQQPEFPKTQPALNEPSEFPTLIARHPDAGPETGLELRSERPPASQDPGLAHLQQVQSGQPSASRIDVIPPRRPHPLLKPESSPQKPIVPPDSDSKSPEQPYEPVGDSAPNIQMQKGPSQTQPNPTPDRPAPDQLPPARQIPTEIGPLPEDLWRLLGEEPPPAEGDTAPMPPAKSSQDAPAPGNPRPPEASIASDPAHKRMAAETAKTEQGAIQRAISAAESRPGPETPAHETKASKPAASNTPLKHVLPPIQHLQTAINIPEIGGPTPEQPAQTKEPELDLDELARQVYGQVRRKLEIEFERQHRRS